jgi:hypothetical protein
MSGRRQACSQGAVLHKADHDLLTYARPPRGGSLRRGAEQFQTVVPRLPVIDVELVGNEGSLGVKFTGTVIFAPGRRQIGYLRHV